MKEIMFIIINELYILIVQFNNLRNLERKG
jgi:hypothetical protein